MTEVHFYGFVSFAAGLGYTGDSIWGWEEVKGEDLSKQVGLP